jgi:hypothetical protein
LLNAPPILPIAVRQAPANTTFFAIFTFSFKLNLRLRRC